MRISIPLTMSNGKNVVHFLQQHPHPFPPSEFVPHPPQKMRRRIIQRQLSLFPHPPLSFPHPHPNPPQQKRRIRINAQEEIPHPPKLDVLLSQPHPQFVALSSLMFVASNRFSLHFHHMSSGLPLLLSIIRNFHSFVIW